MVNLLIGVANKIGINPILLLSVCHVETGLRTLNNFNDGGSYGIAQVQLNTARIYAPYADILSLQQPEFNAIIASKYLKTLLDKYKDPWSAVAAYNAGSLRYKNGKLINKKYVDKVKKAYYHYEKAICLKGESNDTSTIQKTGKPISFCKAYPLQ